MTKYLLDTHTFLWFISNNQRLSKAAKSLMEENNHLLVSTASLWEIAIKDYQLKPIHLNHI